MLRDLIVGRKPTLPPISGKIDGGIIYCEAATLAATDLCWIADRDHRGNITSISGSIAFTDDTPVERVSCLLGRHPWLRCSSDESTIRLTDLTFLDWRIGQLIHPGHPFVSFVCRTIEITDDRGTSVYGRTVRSR